MEQLLLGCPAYAKQSDASVKVFVPNSIPRRFWRLKKGTQVVLKTSPNNPGAATAAASLHKTLPLLQCKSVDITDNELEPTHMLLYLNSDTFVGEAGAELADEVRHHLFEPVTPGALARRETKQAILNTLQESTEVATQKCLQRSCIVAPKVIPQLMQCAQVVPAASPSLSRERSGPKSPWRRKRPSSQRLPLLMLHEMNPDAGGCEFDRFFETTPQDLIAGGLYRSLACALHHGDFLPVSVGIVAKMAGALDKQPLSVRLACGLLPNQGQQIGGAKVQTLMEKHLARAQSLVESLSLSRRSRKSARQQVGSTVKRRPRTYRASSSAPEMQKTTAPRPQQPAMKLAERLSAGTSSTSLRT